MSTGSRIVVMAVAIRTSDRSGLTKFVVQGYFTELPTSEIAEVQILDTKTFITHVIQLGQEGNNEGLSEFPN